MAGRPRKDFNKDQFEKLCQMQCTEEEMCGFFGTTDKTLSRWCVDTYGGNFSETYKTYSQDGKISLRRLQWKSAQSGNTTMLIWLGKQWLGQTDRMEMETTAVISDEARREIEELFEDEERKDKEDNKE